ncbi:MAG: hypothetical protein ACO1NX_04055 [Chitinophagaceae bacterium]
MGKSNTAEAKQKAKGKNLFEHGKLDWAFKIGSKQLEPPIFLLIKHGFKRKKRRF